MDPDSDYFPFQENDFSLEVKTSQMKARDKTKVTQTFHGAGLIVPYDKETQVRQFEVVMTAEMKIETYFTYVFPRFRQRYDRQLHTCTRFAY